MIVFLVDADNLNSPAWVNEAINSIESTEGPIAVRRAYGSAENLKGLADSMRDWAIRPFLNVYLTKNTTDMALAVDAMELACQASAPSTMVIGSGDADFVPLVVRLRERGIKVLCASEYNKMAPEAIKAYDSVIYVGRGGANEVVKEKVVPALGATEVSGDAKICKVSIVGIGMRSHVGIASKMFRSLSEEGINIQMISTSEIKTSVVIDEKYMELAVRALHKAFDLDQA